MIRLTSYTSGKAVSVSPELIKAVIEDENFTYIHFGPDDDYIKVSESREEVARKVLEWKLAMVDYRDTVRGYRQMARQTLEELAGLHDKKLDALVDGIIKRMEEPNHDT